MPTGMRDIMDVPELRNMFRQFLENENHRRARAIQPPLSNSEIREYHLQLNMSFNNGNINPFDTVRPPRMQGSVGDTPRLSASLSNMREMMRRQADAVQRLGGNLFPDGVAPEMLRFEVNESEGEKKDRKEQEKVQKQLSEIKQFKPGQKISTFVSEQIKILEKYQSHLGDDGKTRLKWLRTFNNCVLPEEVKEIIEEALTIVLLKNKFDEWGMTEHFEKGITNSILVYGPPGTGKTMVSESIAAVLDKNLLKVNAAAIQSQIPGQAERNITENFDKARKNNAVLMFDECDSLLYDRNSVGMIMASEINHLLTEIERFEGVCILTTNRLGRLDEALQRRIVAKIELGLPEKKERLQIWKNLIPKKMPIDKKIDFDFLSEFKLSGGDIKNAVLIAARKAIAKNAKKVTMDHFKQSLEFVYKSKQDFERSRPKALDHIPISVGMDKMKGCA